MGDVANGVFEQQLRQYLPNTWQDTLNMINGAPIPNGALGTQNIYSNLYSEFDPLCLIRKMKVLQILSLMKKITVKMFWNCFQEI